MNSSIHIRLCVPGDEDALALVGVASFLETFAGVLGAADIVAHCANQHAAAVYRSWLEDGNVRTWIAEAGIGNAPVGYLVLAPPKLPVADPRPNDLEVKRIYLLHRFQGNGLGRRLMAKAITFAGETSSNRLLLGVYSKNDAAIAFYERCGFRTVGERRFLVGDTEYEDFVMALELKAA
ncbi:MAG TPA: GNAT family N-acetyltransferase [Chthoniobacterales bacterium]